MQFASFLTYRKPPIFTLKSYSGEALSEARPVRRSFLAKADVTVWRIWVSAERTSQKQGKLGLDAGAPREALDLTPCKRGKPAGGPRSPPLFSNQICHTAGEET